MLLSLGSAATTTKVYLPITARSVELAGDIGSSAPAATATPTALISTATATRAATPTTAATPVPTTTSVDRTILPLGDGKYKTTSASGYVMTCSTTFDGGGARVDGPWINTSAGTYNSLAKAVVDGTVTWSSHSVTVTKSGSTRTISGNGLPSHTTGVYPIARTDDAYTYDTNPHAIASRSLSLGLRASPTVASTPGCLGGGAIGIMLTGTVFFDAFDAGGRDAPAHETLDSCQGHPQASGLNHYHALSDCVAALDAGTGHSSLIGYAYDGFGVYGLRGSDGQTLTSAQLDECHGHTHTITWDGTSTSMYHYHATYDFPYLVACYKGGVVNTGQSPRGAASWRGRAGP
jgi:hypothetical protein